MTAEDTTRAAYAAATAGAAWAAWGAEGRIEVRGPDRVSWLQGLLTNDVAALAPDSGCYAAYLTPQGRMIADVRVLVREDAVWLDVPGSAKDGLLARLESFVISEDVELRDLTDVVARIGVYGPAAAEVISTALVPPGEHRQACARRLGDLAEHAHLARPWQGHDVLVAATRDYAVTGFDLYVARAEVERVVAALGEAGALPIDAATLEVLRIEAGRPRFGADMDETTIPLEAGLEDRAISFTKGCYVGQEVIVRVRDRGHGKVARRLMRITEVAAYAGPQASFGPGAILLVDGKEIGRVTSAAWSPRAGRTVALGYVQRAHAEAGARARVGHDAGEIVVEFGRAGGEAESASPSVA